MQNLDPKTVQMIQIAENAIARVHDDILIRYIVETLLTKGKVTIEEAQFFNKLSKKIITESSHLFIPSNEELSESLMVNLEEEAKVLVDPETGDKFVYYPDTGELVPATDEDVAGMEGGSEDQDNDGVPDAEEDADVEDPASGVNEDDVDVSASCVAKDKKEVKETTEVQESTEAKKEKEELNENELLVKQLLSTLKEL